MIHKPLAMCLVSLTGHKDLAIDPNVFVNSSHARGNRIKPAPTRVGTIKSGFFSHRNSYPTTSRLSHDLHSLKMITDTESSSSDSPSPFYPTSSPLPMGLGFNVIGNSVYPLWEFKFKAPIEKSIYQSQPHLFSVDITSLLPRDSFYLSLGPNHLGVKLLGSEGLSSYELEFTSNQFKKNFDENALDKPCVMLVPKQCSERVLTPLFKTLSKVNTQAGFNNLLGFSSFFSDLGFVLSSEQNRCLNQKNNIGFLEAVLKEGLMHREHHLSFSLVKTTPSSIHEFLCEHRCLPISVHVIKLQEQVSNNRMPPHSNNFCLRSDKQLFSSHLKTQNTLSVHTSKTTDLGRSIRQCISPNFMLDVSIQPSLINQYLPEKLKPFPHPNPDVLLRIKKDVLFNPWIASTIFSQMVVSFDNQGLVNLSDFMSFLSDQSRGESGIFNCIITDTALVLAPTKVFCEPVDTVLSKHVFMSQYNNVRFAGELRIDNDCVVINRNSGTYIPEQKHLNGAVRLLSDVFTDVTVLGENLDF